MAADPTTVDIIVVGGGTSGAVLARRLADAGTSVALLEAGPSDEDQPAILELRRWPELLGSRWDYDYATESQGHVHDRIRHSRGRMLGGCSSHNSAIAFVPPDLDFERWQRAGAAGWGPSEVAPYFERVRERVHLEPSDSGNALVAAFLDAAAVAGLPRLDFRGPFVQGAGRFLLNKRGALRQSSSVAYLHPLGALPAGLQVVTGVRVRRLLFEGARALGVETSAGRFLARREVVLCAGAFGSPQLLLLSGVGPAEQLRALGIPVVHELPGVGENLQDHPEGVVTWQSARPVPPETSNLWEAGAFMKVDADAPWPDLMLHFGIEAFDLHTAPLGYASARHAFSLTPNATRARSRGSVRLRSADPDAPPRIDTGFFSDPEGHDLRLLVAGIRRARELVAQVPLAAWAQRELTPGAEVVSDDALAEYVRRTANTVYHPAGTCRMGAADDRGAVVDPQLRVRGLEGLRVADASVFPTLPSVNPCLSCMMVGERAASSILSISS